MRRLAAGLTVVLLGMTACGTSGHGTVQTTTPPATRPSTPKSSATTAHSSTTAPASSSHPPTTSPPPRPGSVDAVLDAMTEAQRVGQLFMIDCPTTGVSDATATAISRDDVGAVILDGTTHQGLAATQQVTARLRALAPAGVGLFIATDEEGGLVQRLQGPGFPSIPTAVDQAALGATALRADAAQWGAVLKSAGVNVNLAPVVDTVPLGQGSNPPIGDLYREYGHTPAAVAPLGVAVVEGYLAAGVDPTVKHFPGLGRVTGNTDTSPSVTDYVTTRTDPYLGPFAAAVRAGAPFVMMSTAIYANLDATAPAAFSKTIVTGMLRGDLGFRGVIISDDLGAAVQVSGTPIGQRAVDFILAGGSMVLTVDATQASTMTAAVLARAQSDPAFRAQVDAAARVVLTAKARLGLLH